MTKKKKDRNKLPVYEIVIDDTDNTTGIKMISLLDDPAIEVKGQAFKRPRGLVTPPCHFADAEQSIPNCQCDIIYNPLIGDHEWITGDNPCEFCIENKMKWDDLNTRFSKQEFKQVDDKQIIVGPFLIPDFKIFRKEPDTGEEYFVVFSKEVIVQIVEKFNKGNNNLSFNVDHTNVKAPAYLMENWIIADSLYDKSKVYGYDLPVGSWFGVVKINDTNFWNEQVKGLGKQSFSVEGILGQKLLKFGLKQPNNDDLLLQELTNNQLIQLAEYAMKLLGK